MNITSAFYLLMHWNIRLNVSFNLNKACDKALICVFCVFEFNFKGFRNANDEKIFCQSFLLVSGKIVFRDAVLLQGTEWEQLKLLANGKPFWTFLHIHFIVNNVAELTFIMSCSNCSAKTRKKILFKPSYLIPLFFFFITIRVNTK